MINYTLMQALTGYYLRLGSYTNVGKISTTFQFNNTSGKTVVVADPDDGDCSVIGGYKVLDGLFPPISTMASTVCLRAIKCGNT